jgi:radical SAM superfamily enzyme YgiQ (UPF0313 family)
MRILMISSNTLPAAPSGPAYVAGAARQAGHEVAAFESLFATDPPAELAAQLQAFQPDVAALSIRLVHGDVQDDDSPLSTRYVDLRPRVKELVEAIRRHSNAHIVLGGPGFNYYAAGWLEYLDADYGIRGEGEESFPVFLDRLVHGGDVHSVPGCVYRQAGQICAVPPRPVENLNAVAPPAYDLFDLRRYAAQNIAPAILTKRGCAYGCNFCPYAKLEGWRYRLKTPERVLAEIRHTLAHSPARTVTFCDNNFNAPRRHAEELMRAFIASGEAFTWTTGSLRPGNITGDFCRLLKESGCTSVNLSIESASDRMLRRMKRGYTAAQVRQSIEVLSRSKIPFGAGLLLGGPGETPETIAESLALLADYDIPLGLWFTIGVYLWTDYQDVVAEARQSGQLGSAESLFDGPVYLSPELPRPYLVDLIASLRAHPGYGVQVNRADRFFAPAIA